MPSSCFGFKSGLNRMVVCSMVCCRLPVKRRNPFRFFPVLSRKMDNVYLQSFLPSHAFLITPCRRNSLTSSSVDDSVKPVATARTEFCSFPVRLHDEFLLSSSAWNLASILVCIASSAFAFSSIFASTLASRASFSCHIVDRVALSVAVILSLILFCQSHDSLVILLCQSFHVFVVAGLWCPRLLIKYVDTCF